MPSYPPKFQPGDTVTIRTWDDMLSQYGSRKGSRIKTPYITISYDMKQYCGRSFKVNSVRPSLNDEHWIYTLDNGSYFPFTEYMFVLPLPVPASTISFDDLLKGAT